MLATTDQFFTQKCIHQLHLILINVFNHSRATGTCVEMIENFFIAHGCWYFMMIFLSLLLLSVHQ